MKESSLVNGYSKWDNDVAKGEKPFLIETNNLTGKFIDNARLKGEAYGEESRNATDREDDGRNRGNELHRNEIYSESSSGEAKEHGYGNDAEIKTETIRQLSGTEHPEYDDRGSVESLEDTIDLYKQNSVETNQKNADENAEEQSEDWGMAVHVVHDSDNENGVPTQKLLKLNPCLHP